MKTVDTRISCETRVVRNALAVVLALVALVPLSIREAQAAISVSPAYVEVSLNGGRAAGQFLISNLGDEEERYRIRAIHFTFTKDGGLNHVQPNEHSLATWVKFNPTEFTVGPRTERIIRYVIVPQGLLKTGEYWAAMELESLKTSMSMAKDASGRDLRLQVISSLLVPIFGTFGKVRYGGLLEGVNVAPANLGQRIQFIIKNTGEGKLLLQGQYVIRNSAGQSVENGSIAASYILPGLDQTVSSQLSTRLPEGTYSVHVECRSSQLREPIASDFPLVVKPSP